MKHTKKIGKIVTLAVLTVVALFYMLPNVAFIEQSLEIRATPDRVFELINRPENWAEWYEPLRDTSGVQMQLTGAPVGKGSGMKWNTHNPDGSSGIMNIRSAKNNRNVTAAVTINDRRSAVMNFKIRPSGTDASMLTVSTRLQFRQDSLLHYLRLMFDRSDELEIIDCLENIDEVAIGKAGGIDVHLQRVESFPYISVEDSCAFSEVLLRIKELYEELLVFSAKAGITVTGRPFAIYHRFGKSQAVFELGIPVPEKVPVAGRVKCTTMPAREYAVASYYGSYDTLEDGHNAVQTWLMRYRRKLAGFPWELYVTDPSTEADPNQWLTMIFYPVE